MRRILLLSILLFLLVSNSYSQSKIQQFQNQIDSLVHNAIDSSNFPGAQVVIMHKDKFIVNKAYGYHTYDRRQKVTSGDLYDLASVTKVMAGGMALMKMQDMGLFSPDEKLGDTHPSFASSEKADISWKEILAHQSGMQPYIVFWQTAKNKRNNYKWRTFSFKQNKWNSITIDNEIYLHRRYPKVMRKLIRDSDVNSEKKYLYSGLGFLLIPDLVFRRTGKELDHFLEDELFKPLGLDRITFKPSDKFPINQIVPTELDTSFRNKLVHGYVHDENASMLNGVSANAGLFSSATSLALISQFLLNNNGDLISSEIINEYTRAAFPGNENRRGLAFDKPLLVYDARKSYVAESASPSSFGHSGFTGTFIWIDPEHELTVILLTNRVYPFRSNRSLYTSNFRPILHQAAYDYITNKNE